MNITYTKPVLNVLNMSDDLRRATFQISGLPRGKSESLGTCLRRNLLGFIPGMAPVAMKIIGAEQEYMPIKGIVEDTNTLAIKMKNLKIAVYDPAAPEEMPAEVILEIEGTYSNKFITFGDFKLASGFEGLEMEVLNADEKLAYVGLKDVHVSIQVLLQRGIGYSCYSVSNKGKGISDTFKNGCIYLDSLFSPIVTSFIKVKETEEDSNVKGVDRNSNVGVKGLMKYIPGLSPAAVKVKSAGNNYRFIDRLRNMKVVAYSKKENAVPEFFSMHVVGTSESSSDSVSFGNFILDREYVDDIEIAFLNPDEEFYFFDKEGEDIELEILFSREVSYNGASIRGLLGDINEKFKDATYIDSVFTPVIDLNTRTIKQTPTKTTETLEITVETDGSIFPADAIMQALLIQDGDNKMLMSLFSRLVTDRKKPTDVIKMRLDSHKADTEFNRPGRVHSHNGVNLASEIELLNLPTAIYDTLKDGHINTLADMKENKVAIENKEEIISYLQKAGLTVEDCDEILYK